MDLTNKRLPSVAGQFYPGAKNALRNEIEKLLRQDNYKIDALACVMPHAGYAYSGEVAASVTAKVRIKKNLIILGPNHHGIGAPISLMRQGVWHTPLGETTVNSRIADSLLKSSGLFTDDPQAHLIEHSIEVIIPFFQYLSPDFQIVPVTVMNESLQDLESAGVVIARTLEALNLKDDALIVASSDMTHYENDASARKKDMLAIEDIIKLDEQKLFNDVKKHRISMCGLAPVIIAMVAAKNMGAEHAELINYRTSGDYGGDYLSVVGYAGLIIS